MRNGLILLVLAAMVLVLPACRPPQKTDDTKTAASGSETKDAGKTATTEQNKAKTEDSEILIPVRAEHPTRGSMNLYFETPTRVEAETRVQVSAEAIGVCTKVCVEEGDRVKSGDVLAELDKTELQATIGQTQVQVRQQKTTYDIAERSLADGLVSRVERDNALFAYQQSQETLKGQMARLAKLTIRAPVSGIVIKRNVQMGQIVSNGVPVFIVVDPDSYMLVINPPERDLPRLRIGQEAKVTIDAYPNEEFSAKVRRINPAVDQASGTIKVVLDFDPATRKRLRDSAFARVRLVLETHDNALRVAKDTLIEENARKYAFVVKPVSEPTNDPVTGGTSPVTSLGESTALNKVRYEATRVEVQTGFEDSKNVEILSGLDDASMVVTMGQHTLKSGAMVTLTDEESELNANAGMNAQDALKAAQEKRDADAAKNLAAQSSSEPKASADKVDNASEKKTAKEDAPRKNKKNDGASKKKSSPKKAAPKQ